jgi:hypothetical protein
VIGQHHLVTVTQGKENDITDITLRDRFGKVNDAVRPDVFDIARNYRLSHGSTLPPDRPCKAIPTSVAIRIAG